MTNKRKVMYKRTLYTKLLPWVMIALSGIVLSPSYSQQKHALLIGVGDHVIESYSLLGPKNDIPAFRQLLIEKYGFQPENIEVLQGQNAIRSNIVTAFERRLIAPVGENDLALFYFSGHGTQITDVNGDEADGLDEAFIPYDGQSEGTLLIDDDLATLVERIPTSQVVVIIDACHSGTGTRGLVRARRVPAKSLGLPDSPPPKRSSNGKSTTLGEELTNATVISAARADQIAADYPFLKQASTSREAVNPYMGALTYYLLEAASDNPDSSLTYPLLIEHVSAALATDGFEQAPQLEGGGAGTFLTLPAVEAHASPDSVTPGALTLLPAQAHAEVMAVRANEATIKALGGAQLVRGSIFETLDQTIDNEPNAVRLTETSGQTAIAEMLNGRVEAGDRLVETFHFVPQSKLRLAVLGDSTLAHGIRCILKKNNFIEVVNQEDFRDIEFEIKRIADSVTITPYRNQHRLPDIEVNQADSVSAKTRPLLENLYAVNLLSHLKNPNPPFNVDVQVNGKDYDEVGIGSEVAFTVRVDRNAYVYLVDVDPAGKVTVLFPNAYAKDNFLKAGMTHEMPAPNLYRLRVNGPAGPELVKAIATTQPLKLDILTSDSGNLNALDESAVTVARAILDQLKREVNRVFTRGIVVLPAAAAEQPIATEGWASDEVLLRVGK
ncbi:MAG: DUF4384 domain-containing protein [bacterium]